MLKGQSGVLCVKERMYYFNSSVHTFGRVISEVVAYKKRYGRYY